MFACKACARAGVLLSCCAGQHQPAEACAIMKDIKDMADLKALNAATKHCCVQKVRALCLRARFPAFSLQTMQSKVLSAVVAIVQAGGHHNGKASPSTNLRSCKKIAPNPQPRDGSPECIECCNQTSVSPKLECVPFLRRLLSRISHCIEGT